MFVKAGAIIPMMPQMSFGCIATGRGTSVVANSTALRRLENKAGYEAFGQGRYYGAGCFYGPESINSVNIKIAKRAGPCLIRINK
jgi:hypothetical protein